MGSAIALGLLGDGEQLPAETDLATMLNVSTVTLRDALAELRELGLVETRRGRGGGSFVRPGTTRSPSWPTRGWPSSAPPTCASSGDVHGAVAAAAARLAAGRASPPRSPGCATSSTGSPAESVTGQRRADGRFYVELAACAQSVRLTMQEMELHLELGQLPWPPADVPALLAEIVAAHRAVLDAIERRDAARARELTEEHVDPRRCGRSSCTCERVGDREAADGGGLVSGLREAAA